VPYPYTLDLPQEAVERLYEVALDQFASMGFKVLLAFTGHFGLAQTLAQWAPAAGDYEQALAFAIKKLQDPYQ
jgi:hypothetical protein